VISERRRFWTIFALAATLYLALADARVFFGGNDGSRWAQIEALVDHGSPTLERTRFARTVDRVIVDGKVYSNKPPFFALVGAALYAPLGMLTGWRIGEPESAGGIFRLLTWFLVGVPAAWLVAQFDRESHRFATLTLRWRTALTVALGAGTLVTSYAGTLNSHVPAAALLFASFAALLHGRPAAAGLACGFAAAIDLLPGLGMAPFLAWAAAAGAPRHAPGPARFAAGMVPGMVSFFAANFAVTGTPLPPKWLPGAVDLAALAGPSAAGVVLPEGVTYPLEILFGPHGLFAVSPVLLVGAVGLAAAVRRPPFGGRRLWGALAAGLAVQYAGHALVAGSYGGWAYGYRYLLPIQPLLLFAAPLALAMRGGRPVFAAALPLSVAFALLGAHHPWPPGYEQKSMGNPVADRVRNPIGANAAAVCVERWPGTALCEALATRFVSADGAARARYFELYRYTRGDAPVRRGSGR